MLVAAIAIFAECESVGVVLLIFHCRVIAFFAVGTRQGDDHSIVFLSHGLFSVSAEVFD